MTFVRYIIVQLLAYAIDMGGMLLIVQTGFAGVIVANIVAKTAAALFAFFSHRSFTFRVAQSSSASRQVPRYLLLLMFNVIFASIVLGFLLLWIPNPVVAKIISDLISVGLSFALSRRFVFSPNRLRAGLDVGG